MLMRIASCEQSLAKKSQGAFLETDISPEQCRAFISLVHEKLSAKEPFSFIRIGDGEAHCLPYEPHLTAFTEGDAKGRERVWWGETLSAPEREKLSARVGRAIWSADCLGIPTTARFLRDLRLTEDDALEGGLRGRSSRGLRAVLHALENVELFRPPGLPLPFYASCHLHQDLARWRLYEELFDGVREAVVISCHPQLPEEINRRFGVSIAASIVVPPRYATRPLMNERIGDTRSLPSMLDEIIEKIDDLPRNRLVLVGAGYLGKVLVASAKSRGGVVLDLGSIFDYWVGLRTRGYLDISSG